MTRRRRESNDTPMSFFSFQDIIACTTGIMVLITLMLTLQLVNKTLAWDKWQEDLTPLKNAIAAAKKDRDAMKEKIKQAEADLEKAREEVFVTEGTVKAIERAIGNLKRENEVTRGEVARTKDERDKLHKAITGLEGEVAVLKAGNATLAEKVERNKNKTRVTVIRGARDTKRILCVEIGSDVCVVATIPEEGENKGFAEKVKQFDNDDQDPSHLKFLKWASGESIDVTVPPPTKDKDCFVLLIRPEAVEKWQIIAGDLKGRQFDVGWDVWPADKSLLGGP